MTRIPSSDPPPNSFRRWLGRSVLNAAGWTFEGDRPASRRYVLIAAPHSTNWDLFFMLALAWSVGIELSWMGKHTLFRGPLGALSRKLGGVPVRRHERENVVTQMVKAFADRSDLVLTIAPEGTRSYAPHWRSGFYRIALAAEVPIVMGYLDYRNRRGGFGPELVPTGVPEDDMDEIRNFYADKVACFPKSSGEIRLKEEM